MNKNSNGDKAPQLSPEEQLDRLHQQADEMMAETLPNWADLSQRDQAEWRAYGRYMMYTKLDPKSDPDGNMFFLIFAHAAEGSRAIKHGANFDGGEMFLAAFRAALGKQVVAGRIISRSGTLQNSALAPHEEYPGRLNVVRHYLPLDPGHTYSGEEVMRYQQSGYLYSTLSDREENILVVEGYLFQPEPGMTLSVSRYDADRFAPGAGAARIYAWMPDDLGNPAS